MNETAADLNYALKQAQEAKSNAKTVLNARIEKLKSEVQELKKWINDNQFVPGVPTKNVVDHCASSGSLQRFYVLKLAEEFRIKTKNLSLFSSVNYSGGENQFKNTFEC